MRDDEKIAVVRDLIEGGHTKEAIVNFLAGAALKGGSWIAKNPLKSLGLGANAYFVADATRAGAKGVAKGAARPARMPKVTF